MTRDPLPPLRSTSSRPAVGWILRTSRVLLGMHLALGPFIGIALTGTAAALIGTGSPFPLWLFLVLSTVGLALGILPSNTTMLACGVLYGSRGAAFLLPALLLASLPGFLLIRWKFRTDTRDLLQRHPRAETVVDRLESWSFTTGFLLRLAPISTFAWTNALLSVSRLRLWAYIATTFLGLAPRLLLLSWAGSSASSLHDALRDGTSGRTATLALLLSVASLVALALLAAKVLSALPSTAPTANDPG